MMNSAARSRLVGGTAMTLVAVNLGLAGAALAQAAGETIQIGHDSATAGPKDRVWHLSEPYGLGRVVAIVSEHPLYGGIRPIGEPAEAYLDFLGQALPKAMRAGRVAMDEVPIETRAER